MASVSQAIRYLGATRCSTFEEIKSIYRSLAKKYHPDYGGNSDTFKDISLNYSIIKESFSKGDLFLYLRNNRCGHCKSDRGIIRRVVGGKLLTSLCMCK